MKPGDRQKRRLTIPVKGRFIIALLLTAILLPVVFLPHQLRADETFSKKHFLGNDETPWRIKANSLTYKEKEGIYLAEGDVIITKDAQILNAQKAVYNVKKGIASVSGDVRLETNGDIITGEQGVFDLKNKTGRITNGFLFLRDNHYYVKAGVMEKLSEKTYLIKDCSLLTTCDGDNPAWSIKGSEVRVTIEGYGTVKNASFQVLGVPLMYVPYMIFPAKTKRQTGLLPPRMGYSSRNGLDAEVPFFWAVSDRTDATLYQRFMSKRGYMQGLEFRYLADEGSKGLFLFDILSDRKESKDLNDPDEVELSPYARTNNTRYWFRSRADKDLPLGLKARLDTDFVSDQDYLKEFEGGLFGLDARPDFATQSGRSLEELSSPTRRSALRLSRDSENYSLQALASYNQRPEDLVEDRTAQPLGGISFILLPEQIQGKPLFFNVESDYDYVWRDMGQKGHRVFLSPELKFPLWLAGGYLEFEPSLRYFHNMQWFDEPNANRDNQTKRAYEAGARLSASAERTYDLAIRNIRKLKHKISPVLSYTYRARQDQNDYAPWFDPLDDLAGTDKNMNQVALSLENFLDARLEDEKGGVTYRQWGTFILTQGYDIDEARRTEDPQRKRRPLAPLSASMTFTPSSGIDVSGEIGWDHYDNEIEHSNLAFELSIDRAGARKDIFSFDYVFERGSEKSLNFSAHVNLAHGFSVGGALKKDLYLDEDITNNLWLGYRSQCWGVKLVGERSDGGTSFMVIFQILGLGDIQAW